MRTKIWVTWYSHVVILKTSNKQTKCQGHVVQGVESSANRIIYTKRDNETHTHFFVVFLVDGEAIIKQKRKKQPIKKFNFQENAIGGNEDYEKVKPLFYQMNELFYARKQWCWISLTNNKLTEHHAISINGDFRRHCATVNSHQSWRLKLFASVTSINIVCKMFKWTLYVLHYATVPKVCCRIDKATHYITQCFSWKRFIEIESYIIQNITIQVIVDQDGEAQW